MYYIIIERSQPTMQVVRLYLPHPKWTIEKEVREDLNTMSTETSDLDVLQFPNLVELNIFLFDNWKIN